MSDVREPCTDAHEDAHGDHHGEAGVAQPA
jgi:hypothetical protein